MRARGGFTLVEALVALAISGILLVLVSTTFMVQNSFYANILQRARLQDNARSAADLVAADLRSVMPGGIVVADSARLVIRVPMALGVVCAKSGSNVSVHLPGGDAVLPAGTPALLGHRTGPGAWDYYPFQWSDIQTAGTPAASCASNGADTAGVAAQFYEADTGGLGALGDLFMVYRETEYRIQGSALDSAATALFSGPNGGALVELATPMAPDSHFSYRKGTGSWATSFATGLSAIDRVRIHANARGPAETAGQADLTYDLVVEVPLRNVM